MNLRWIAHTLLTVTAFATFGCGGDRFDGQNEEEMFEAVRGELCETMRRCPRLWSDEDPKEPTDSECVEAMDDRRHYEDPIDEGRREQLNQCLDDVEDASCESLESTLPGSCDDVEKLLDLK